MLWSKALPGGAVLDLDTTAPGASLHYRSALGEFFLSSDSFIPSFTGWIVLRPITSQLSEEANEAFRAIGFTIGGMIVWPANRVDRMMTINGARGFSGKIADRMDLILECVRRHSLGQASHSVMSWPGTATSSLFSRTFKVTSTSSCCRT